MHGVRGGAVRLGLHGAVYPQNQWPMSIFGLGDGPVYNCSDLPLNWALKYPFAMSLQGFILFVGGGYLGRISLERLLGGVEKKEGTSSEYDRKNHNVIWGGGNVNYVMKALPSRNVIVG